MKKSSKRNFIPEYRFRFLSFEDFQNLGCFMINTVLPALLQCISEVVRYIATHRCSILGQTFEVRNRLTIQFVFTTLFLCSKIIKVAINYPDRINLLSPRSQRRFFPFSHSFFRHWERDEGRFILWGRIVLLLSISLYY